ncbi:MAG: glycosyltransferase [Alphaproteobacteria bacterium]|nr:glycosyltransferase [Alphaproteobacteria bacterium]
MKILHIAHCHPEFQAGGTEHFALALMHHQRRRGQQSWYVGAAPPRTRTPNPGTALIGAPSESGEFIFAGGEFNLLSLSQADYFILDELERLLRVLAPDVVHFHHVLSFGLEAIAVARRVLPSARLVMTLHDYFPMCPNDGALRRTNGTLCRQSTPGRCLQCRPDAGLVPLRLRDLSVRAAFGLVDAFVAPSAFLAEMYRTWFDQGSGAGSLPPERLQVIQNGHPAAEALPRPAPPQFDGAVATAARPVRIGFFGNVIERKGLSVLLDGFAIAAERTSAPMTLHIHGSDQYASEGLREAISRHRQALGPKLQRGGAYGPQDVCHLMAGVDWVAVPSLWWENDPLVIQEAFHSRRPVLCSAAGGMAERVIDGVFGRQVALGDAAAWADAIVALAEDPTLATRLGAQLPAAHSMTVCADAYQAIYAPP